MHLVARWIKVNKNTTRTYGIIFGIFFAVLMGCELKFVANLVIL